MEVGHETLLILFQQNLFINSVSLSLARHGGEANSAGEFWHAVVFSLL